MPKRTSDFDPDELTKQSKQHEGYILELHNRLQALENRFSSNEQIADTLMDCSRNAVRFREMFAEVLIAQLKTDENLRTTISDFIDSVDRKAVNKWIKRIGIAAWSVFLILITALVTAYFQQKQ